MKAAPTTFILVTANRVARADFDGDLRLAKSAPRPPAVADAIRAALALGGKAARETWVLSADIWSQEVKLNSAQVAGLSQEQIGRALSFEVEPFSGIPVMESATGFRDAGDGMFKVAQMPRAELGTIARAVAGAGGRLAGVAHPGAAPVDDEALLEWWPRQPERIAAGPVVMPPEAEPSPRRFFLAALVMEAAALIILVLIFAWMGNRFRDLQKRNEDFTAASRELDAVNRSGDALRRQLASLEKQDKQREHVHSRRGAVLALLNTLAQIRTDDIVVRGLTAEGPSSMVVSGLSLEAGAVDELSILLTGQLRGAGWIAQPRSKTGRKHMPNGGPWEFAVVLTHEEAERSKAVQLSQNTTE